MASLNVFRNDAFSMISMTSAIERVPYLPTGIGKLGVFTPNPVRTTRLWIESRQGRLYLIPFSERGEEGKQRITETRDGFAFKIPRLMTSDTITATELQDVRAFGGETEMMQVEAEVARRVSGPTGLQASMEYTREYLRLGAVQGYCVDPGNGNILYDFAAEFGAARPAEVGLALPAGTANSLRPIFNTIVRQIMRSAQGFQVEKIVALCGDAAWDALVNHPDVIRLYTNFEDAREIRNNGQGAAFGSFSFAGIEFQNYRGSNDLTEVAIPTDKMKFFPVGPGLFEVALAPAEFMEYVGTPGKEEYLVPIVDTQRNAWWKVEDYSYPLHLCTRPECLASARLEQ